MTNEIETRDWSEFNSVQAAWLVRYEEELEKLIPGSAWTVVEEDILTELNGMAGRIGLPVPSTAAQVMEKVSPEQAAKITKAVYLASMYVLDELDKIDE